MATPSSGCVVWEGSAASQNLAPGTDSEPVPSPWQPQLPVVKPARKAPSPGEVELEREEPGCFPLLPTRGGRRLDHRLLPWLQLESSARPTAPRRCARPWWPARGRPGTRGSCPSPLPTSCAEARAGREALGKGGGEHAWPVRVGCAARLGHWFWWEAFCFEAPCGVPGLRGSPLLSGKVIGAVRGCMSARARVEVRPPPARARGARLCLVPAALWTFPWLAL